MTALAALAACSRGKPPAAPPAPLDTTHHAVRDTTVKADTTQIVPPTAAPPVAPAPPTATKTAKKPVANQKCILDFPNYDPTRALALEVDTVAHRYVTYVGGGISGRCRGQDITIVADSNESYDQSQLYILVGNVHYKEPKVAIDAQRVTYFKAEERLLFENTVHAVMRDSSAVMTGPRAEYFREVQGIRDHARMVATQRPELNYFEKDSLGKPQPPVKVNADVITAEGDSNYYASGQVIITRTDLVATGDSAAVDASKRMSRLMRRPEIRSTGSRPFTLRGRVIDLFGAGKEVDRIIALDSARAVSKDLTLTADTLDMRVSQNHLNRAFAFGRSGAMAVTADRTVIADSLDILMPGQQLRELHAIGKAYVESDPDTARLISEERDWLRGDTIVATFDSVATKDTTSQPDMRHLVASGKASSFYQVPPNQEKKETSGKAPVTAKKPAAKAPAGTAPIPSPTAPPGATQNAAAKSNKNRPALNYIRGRRIELEFVKDSATHKNEVRTVTVQDSASGLYLAPETDTTKAAKKTQKRPSPNPKRPPVIKPPIRRPPTS